MAKTKKPIRKLTPVPARSNGKHPGGRPMKWTPQELARFGRELLAYLAACDGKPRQGLTISEFCHKYNPPFALADINTHIGEAGYEEFSHAYAQAKELVANRIVYGFMVKDKPTPNNNALTTELDPGAARLILMSQHGYREKVDSDVTSAGQPVASGVFIGLPPKDPTPT